MASSLAAFAPGEDGDQPADEALDEDDAKQQGEEPEADLGREELREVAFADRQQRIEEEGDSAGKEGDPQQARHQAMISGSRMFSSCTIRSLRPSLRFL